MHNNVSWLKMSKFTKIALTSSGEMRTVKIHRAVCATFRRVQTDRTKRAPQICPSSHILTSNFFWLWTFFLHRCTSPLLSLCIMRTHGHGILFTRSRNAQNVASASGKCWTQLFYRSDHKYCSKFNKTHWSWVMFSRDTIRGQKVIK